MSKEGPDPAFRPGPAQPATWDTTPERGTPYDAGSGPIDPVACPGCLSRNLVCHHLRLGDRTWPGEGRFTLPQERYQRDAHFRALVDQLFYQIREAHFTPTEIREAAMLAQLRYEDERPRSWLVDPDAARRGNKGAMIPFDPKRSEAPPRVCTVCEQRVLEVRPGGTLAECPGCGAVFHRL